MIFAFCEKLSAAKYSLDFFFVVQAYILSDSLKYDVDFFERSNTFFIAFIKGEPIHQFREYFAVNF
ncbi:hypothetical protein CFB40_34185 [Burkholderia sp. AU31652]|nr:hypothetical protein CFB40_34185 [Burkholderia sp. AU31652]